MMGAIISKPQPEGTIDRLVATGMKTPPSIGTGMLVRRSFWRESDGCVEKD